MTENPGEILRRAAQLIRSRVDAMEAELAENPYWGHPPGDHADAAYRSGVANGLGGASGAMASSWDLSTSRAVAAWLGETAGKAETLVSPQSLCRQCGGWLYGDGDFTCRCWNTALAVARNYFGEVPA